MWNLTGVSPPIRLFFDAYSIALCITHLIINQQNEYRILLLHIREERSWIYYQVS